MTDAPPSPDPLSGPTTPAAGLPAGRDPRAADALLAQLVEATRGEYEIERELGRGGMATVYLAHDRSLHRKVAIKVMAPELFAAGDVLIDRFMREARTGARLNHPNIIPVYAVRESAQLIYFVMKYVDGRALDEVVRAHGPLPVHVAARIVAQAADALAYAHRNGIVHRDVKPGNLMLDGEGWVVVTDLGIAKVQESAMLTATGSAMGTPTYMSPEQSSAASETTGASDQYSLGCVAYELLTGAPPFTADSVVSLIWKHHTEPPPSLARARPDCPSDIAATVAKMLAKKPEDRFGSLEEVAQRFREASGGDEEELRLLLRAFATDAAQSDGGGRLRTPRTPVPTAPPRSTTPRPAARPVARELAATTVGTSGVRADGPPMPTGVPAASAGATLAGGAWPRTMLPPPTAPARRRGVPVGSLVMVAAVVGALAWLCLLPAVRSLAERLPGETALMARRRAAAEAAVRRGTAPGAADSCEGIRRDLAACRRHEPVPLADLPTVLVEATLLAQDSLFRARPGIDWVTMRRALGYPREAFEWGNEVDRADLWQVLPGWSSRMATIGAAGSLTQQMVQTVLLPPDDGVLRKVRELATTARVAATLPPERVLEVYLNTAEFGPGLYGVEAAAQAYFGVSARAVTRSQAAALAATLATPRSSTPALEPLRMRRRQALIQRRLAGEAVAIPAPSLVDASAADGS